MLLCAMVVTVHDTVIIIIIMLYHIIIIIIQCVAMLYTRNHIVLCTSVYCTGHRSLNLARAHARARDLHCRRLHCCLPA